MVKRVVVLGPESTGKSTLCEQLASHFNTSWVPEFARDYLLQRGARYNYDDLLYIAQQQIKLEDQYAEKLAECNPPTLLFIDTDLYVMKVWCEYVFGKCHSWILDQIAIRSYDLYLLCDTDLPWMKDELREYPDLKSRRELYYIYKDIMLNQPIPWINISGSYEHRLAKAVKVVDDLLIN